MRRHLAGFCAFLAIVGIVTIIPLTGALTDPAAADRQTTTQCDYDPVSNMHFNCREVEVAHTHPPPTLDPCLPPMPLSPSDNDCGPLISQIIHGTTTEAPPTTAPPTTAPPTTAPPTTAPPTTAPPTTAPPIIAPPPACTAGDGEHRHAAHGNEPAECHADHTVPAECGTIYQVHADNGRDHTTLTACPAGIPTQSHNHPLGEGHTDFQTHSAEPRCWGVALSFLPGHGHDPIPVPECPEGWKLCSDDGTTSGMNPKPPSGTCPPQTATQALNAAVKQVTHAASHPDFVAEQWGTDSYWEQLARLIKDRTWTAAKEDVIRYVESGLRAAYAEQQRGKVKRFGGNTPIDDLADIIPENVRVGAAGVHGIVSPFTQDVASVVCSDPLTWLSIGADTTNLVPDGVSKRQWLAKLQTKAGGLIKVGKSVSPVGTTATVYCLFIYEETPTGDSGSSFGYSVDDTTSEAEHVMVLVPLSTPVPEPVTVDTCAVAHALPAADLIDDEGLAIHRSSYSLDVITRDDIGNFVIPGSAIVSVKLSEERTLVGSLIESVVYDELDFYVFDEFNDDIVSWTNGGIVEMTLKACAPITTTTTTMPPPSTTTVPPGHE